MPGGSKSQKGPSKTHIKLKKTIHQDTQYLKDNVYPEKEGEDDRYVCILCKEKFNRYYSRYFENLKDHLLNKQHKKTCTTPEDEKLCMESAALLEREAEGNESPEPISQKKPFSFSS